MKWFLITLFLYTNAAMATYTIIYPDCEKITAPAAEFYRSFEYKSCQNLAVMSACLWPLYWMYRFYDRVL